MSLSQELLIPLKQHVNAMEFDSDDALLECNIKRALRQFLRKCNRSLGEIMEMAYSLDESELECGYPADFTGAVIELAAAMYRYGEAYDEKTLRMSPSFLMVLSDYWKYPDHNEEQNEGA